jgi:multicomponent Na+:H+ antiporter subunit G
MTLLANLLIITGILFIIAGVLGILRLPDFYARLHAMGKCDTLGVALVLVGLAMRRGVSIYSVKILLISVFVSLANPTATHALARAALKSGLSPWLGKEDGA